MNESNSLTDQGNGRYYSSFKTTGLVEEKNVEVICIWAWSLLYYLGKSRIIDWFMDMNY